MYIGKEGPPLLAPLDQNVVLPLPLLRPSHEEANLAYSLVVKLLNGLWHYGHTIAMDNYFFGPLDLLSQSIYATGTLKANHIGLSKDLRKTKSFKNVIQASQHIRKCMITSV